MTSYSEGREYFVIANDRIVGGSGVILEWFLRCEIFSCSPAVKIGNSESLYTTFLQAKGLPCRFGVHRRTVDPLSPKAPGPTAESVPIHEWVPTTVILLPATDK